MLRPCGGTGRRPSKDMGDPKSIAATLAEARLGQRAAARATSGSGAAEGVARPGSGFSATGGGDEQQPVNVRGRQQALRAGAGAGGG